MSDEACEKRTEPQDTEVAKNREEDFSRKKAKERAQRNARRGGSQKPEARGRKPDFRKKGDLPRKTRSLLKEVLAQRGKDAKFSEDY